MGSLAILLLIAAGITAFVLLVIFVMVPLFKGIGWLIVNFFRAVGWLINHIVGFIIGMISDTLRFVGAIIAMVVLTPLTLLNVVIGRWSAAGHFASSVKRECKVAGLCLYRVALQRPLNLVLLHGLLEGIEQRVPEAMAGAPTADRPSRRVGKFDNYKIVGSLRGGGSGAKLYIAEPLAALRQKGMPDRVVIKSFAVSEGSSLPQIVRESRALESARQLGLVLEHGMDDNRFYYVMPYHAGEHLGIVTRQLHGESGTKGLGPSHLKTGLGYVVDLVSTLTGYHRGGLWHKDVKPDNVIIDQGRARLVDLGLVTPLRSAMTLTTHGTEYFRDPEMVRQALRGVKVHQVDGAKFDIYAAGAVLYFVLENTFPAHGGLSRFTKKSPESLRWIVRRSMADYNQRYETADALLADLEVVLAASDPHAVKPADLPSMRDGGAPVDAGAAAAVVGVAAAGSPVPPRKTVVEEELEAAKAEIAEALEEIGITPRKQQPEPPVVTVASASGRPKLDVVNWWTGAYRVADAGSVAPAAAQPDARDVSRAFRQESHVFQRQVNDINQRFHSGAISARRAAREQVKAARERARDIRRRAGTRRHQLTASRQPSPFLALMTLGAVALIALCAVVLIRADRGRDRGPVTTIITDVIPDFHSGASWQSGAVVFDGPIASGRPLVIVPDGLDAEDTGVMGRLADIYIEYGAEGYHLVDWVEDPGLYATFDRWLDDPEGPANAMLEKVLHQHELYGVLHVTRSEQEEGWLEATVVHSTWPDAELRRRPTVQEPSPPAQPLLLLNDHPSKSDRRVEEQIDRIVSFYRNQDWSVVVDNDAEAKFRTLMPAGDIDPQAGLPPRLTQVLLDHELAGVLRIGRRDGPGELHERITVDLLRPDPRLN